MCLKWLSEISLLIPPLFSSFFPSFFTIFFFLFPKLITTATLTSTSLFQQKVWKGTGNNDEQEEWNRHDERNWHASSNLDFFVPLSLLSLSVFLFKTAIENATEATGKNNHQKNLRGMESALWGESLSPSFGCYSLFHVFTHLMVVITTTHCYYLLIVFIIVWLFSSLSDCFHHCLIVFIIVWLLSSDCFHHLIAFHHLIVSVSLLSSK